MYFGELVQQALEASRKRRDRIPIITGIGLVTPLGNTAGRNLECAAGGAVHYDARAVSARQHVAGSDAPLAIAAAREAVGADARWERSARRAALGRRDEQGSVDAWTNRRRPPRRSIRFWNRPPWRFGQVCRYWTDRA
jgi:hypothetical protein